MKQTRKEPDELLAATLFHLVREFYEEVRANCEAVCTRKKTVSTMLPFDDLSAEQQARINVWYIAQKAKLGPAPKPSKQAKKRAKKAALGVAVAQGVALAQTGVAPELHDKMLSAALEANISLKQINDGQIKIHFRGERGDQVSFVKAAQTHFQLLLDVGAVDESYEFAVNRFYALWEAHRRALGAWEGKGGAEIGEDPIDELLDRQRLYSVLTRNLKPVYVLNMQILSENRDGNADREKVLNYLLPLTPVWQETLKIAQGILENLEEIANEELQKALAQTVKF